MRKIILGLAVLSFLVLSCCIIFADNNKRSVVVIGGSTACLYKDDGQHIIKKSGWIDSFSSYAGNGYNVENFTKQGQSLSDVINTEVFEKTLEDLDEEDIVLLQIEEIDYTKENFTGNLEYLIEVSDNNGYRLILILPYHSKAYYAGELKNIFYKDDDVMGLDGINDSDIIDPNFKITDKDRDIYEFVYSVYKDKSKGYDHEGFNYIYADCYGRALADYLNTGDFNIENTSYKITRGMFISQLLKFANQEMIDGDSFSDVKETDEFYDDIVTAKALGIVSGYDSNFYPNDEISCGDACLIAANLLELKGHKLDKFIKETLLFPNVENEYQRMIKLYADVMGVEPYAAEATVDLLMCKVYMNATDVDSQKTFTILAIYRYVYDELYN
mgnify:FL=1